MASISICMIVKNEEDVIGRCLECVSDLFDEINHLITKKNFHAVKENFNKNIELNQKNNPNLSNKCKIYYVYLKSNN